MGVHVRLDCIPVFSEAIIKSVVEHSEAAHHLCCKEDPGGNPHVHLYLDTTHSANEIRTWFARKHPEFKRADKCIKQWGDEEKDKAYFCKGKGAKKGIDIVSSSYSFVDHLRWNAMYWEVNAEKKIGTTGVEALVAEARRTGKTGYADLASILLKQRAGREGLCPFKHGPWIRSAYYALHPEDHVSHVEEFLEKCRF